MTDGTGVSDQGSRDVLPSPSVGPSGAWNHTLIRAVRAEIGSDPHFSFRPPPCDPVASARLGSRIMTRLFDLTIGEGRCPPHGAAHGLGYALPLSLDEAVATGRIAVANLLPAQSLYDARRVTDICVIVQAHRPAPRFRRGGSLIAGANPPALCRLPLAQAGIEGAARWGQDRHPRPTRRGAVSLPGRPSPNSRTRRSDGAGARKRISIWPRPAVSERPDNPTRQTWCTQGVVP